MTWWTRRSRRRIRLATRYSEADLWAWVKELPDKQRLAVGYRYGADMAYEDIAVLLECTPAAARRSVFEGLRTLRRQLEPEEART